MIRNYLAAAFTVGLLFANLAQASVTIFNNRAEWNSAVGNSQTIDFATLDSGLPISNPPADLEFASLTLKGVTFYNVHSYYNSYLVNYPNPVTHIDLPANTLSFGVDLHPLYQVGGYYTITLSTGEFFPVTSSGTPAINDFFGIQSTSQLQWVEITLNSTFLAIDNFSFAGPASQQVRIDIKPDTSGNEINPVNPGSNGVIPVAIISTSTFDARTVNPTTVRFGRTGTEAAPSSYSIKDSNGDGILDLVVQFPTQNTGIRCGDTTAKLTGKTNSNLQIIGSDAIKTVGCN